MLHENRRIPVVAGLVFFVPIIFLAGCNKVEKPSFRVFASPDDAGSALIAAARSGDQNAALAIFGTDSKEIIFDTAAGKEEILARRIGRNELAVIDVCGALADAQAEYFSQNHSDGGANHYALKFISDTGQQNGLYWDSPEGQPKSPLGPLVAFATTEGYGAKPNSHVPFHGYYFHMLNRQGGHAQGGTKDYVVDGKMVGGFAFVAYPAEYGNSGVMTFMINQDGVLLQKDLGKTTTETAAAMGEFDPDTGWSQVEEP
jgi:hypothetical protein